MANHVMYCILATSIKTYHLVIETIDQLKVLLVDGDGNEILRNFKISIVLHIV